MTMNLVHRHPLAGPPKHVIAVYKHGAQTVTCVCGWHGSTAPSGGRTGSEWKCHVAEHKGQALTKGP